MRPPGAAAAAQQQQLSSPPSPRRRGGAPPTTTWRRRLRAHLAAAILGAGAAVVCRNAWIHHREVLGMNGGGIGGIGGGSAAAAASSASYHELEALLLILSDAKKGGEKNKNATTKTTTTSKTTTTTITANSAPAASQAAKEKKTSGRVDRERRIAGGGAGVTTPGDRRRRRRSEGEDPLASAMDEVVRLLFSVGDVDQGGGLEKQQEAEEYLRAYPSRDFRFYVYGDEEMPSRNFTWQFASRCVESCPKCSSAGYGKGINDPKEKAPKKMSSNCDWGSSICTETTTSASRYSSRRHNRNGDVVLSKVLSEYRGELRTNDPARADLFVVPFPFSAYCACVQGRTAKCFKAVSSEHLRDDLVNRLPHYGNSTMHRHLFLASIWKPFNHPFMLDLPLLATLETDRATTCLGRAKCGHVVIPYTNTNDIFQPNNLVGGGDDDRRRRTYALSVVMNSKIVGDRKNVRTQLTDLLGNWTARNATIGGLPVRWQEINKFKRAMLDELTIFRDMYMKSVFCPCMRGDGPAQKRIFDAWMSGCIPVVVKYNKSHEGNSSEWPSHFISGGASIRATYPFSRGAFAGYPHMGIDYRKLVVEIDGDKGKCGIPCLKEVLEDWMQNRTRELAQIRRNIARYARLFSFGMQHNALRYPDAVAAMLVQARHYVNNL